MQFPFSRRHLLIGALAGLPLLLPTRPALADWREELGTFRIGMVAAAATGLSPGELERIRTAFANALQMPAEIQQARDLPALVDALVSGRVDYAMLSTAAYASSHLACTCTEPLANAVMADGSTGTIAVLLADSAIPLGSISTSKGIVIPGRDNFNAYGVALAGLPAAIPAFVTGAPFIVDSGSPEAAFNDFAAGKADGLIAAIPDNRKPGEELKAGYPLADLLEKSGRKVAVAWRSASVPNAPHVVRQNLSAEAKNSLVGFLEGLATQDPDLNDILLPEGAVSFRRVSHPAFGNALNAAKALAATASQPTP